MEGPVRCHKEKQTLGIKYCSFGFVKRANQICKEVIKSLWIFMRCGFYPGFILQVFYQHQICYVVLVRFAGIQSYGVAEISCPWASILLHF